MENLACDDIENIKNEIKSLRRHMEEYKRLCEFEREKIESYLNYKGLSFTKRFDPNSWIYITKAIDIFDLVNGKNEFTLFKDSTARFLVLSFSSDWLYPSYQSLKIVNI